MYHNCINVFQKKSYDGKKSSHGLFLSYIYGSATICIGNQAYTKVSNASVSI